MKDIINSTYSDRIQLGVYGAGDNTLQSFPELIQEFQNVPEYYISTKMDGTSVTMY